MVRRKTYEVTAERSGKYWAVEVAGVGPTQGRTLAEVETMARDLIAIHKDVEPDSFDVDITVTMPAGTTAKLEEAQRLRDEAAAAQNRAAGLAREAAAELHASGMTMRDIGHVLGVSHQRAHQLVNG